MSQELRERVDILLDTYADAKADLQMSRQGAVLPDLDAEDGCFAYMRRMEVMSLCCKMVEEARAAAETAEDLAEKLGEILVNYDRRANG